MMIRGKIYEDSKNTKTSKFKMDISIHRYFTISLCKKRNFVEKLTFFFI